MSKIVDLFYSGVGVHVILSCCECNSEFKAYQPTVAGIAIGQHECPNCKSVIKIVPDDFEKELERLFPSNNFEDIKHIILEASRIAESWYRFEPFSSLLDYKGINLGEPTELGLLPDITRGLKQAQSVKDKK